MSMLRELARRDRLNDVIHIHCVAQPRTTSSSASMMRGLAKRQPGLQPARAPDSGEEGRLTPADLDDDGARTGASARPSVSGPGEMLDAMLEHWEAEQAMPSACTWSASSR